MLQTQHTVHWIPLALPEKRQCVKLFFLSGLWVFSVPKTGNNVSLMRLEGKIGKKMI